MEAIQRRLLALLSFYSSVPVGSLMPTSRAENTVGWDSACNLNLLAAIEAEYGVEFGAADVMRLRSIEDLARWVAEQTAGAGPR